MAVVRVILSILIVLFCVSKFSYAFVIDSVVAVANNEIILLSDLDNTVKSYMKFKYFFNEKNINNMYLENIYSEMLLILTDDKIFEHEVRFVGIEVTSNEIDDAVEFFLKENKNIYETLKSDNVILDSFKNSVKKQIAKDKFINKHIYPKILITDKEVMEFYEKNEYKYENKTEYELCITIFKLYNSEVISKNIGISTLSRISNILNLGVDFEYMTKVCFLGKIGSLEYLGFFNRYELSDSILRTIKNIEIGSCSNIFDLGQELRFFYIKDVINDKSKLLVEVKDIIFHDLLLLKCDHEFLLWFNSVKDKSIIKILW